MAEHLPNGLTLPSISVVIPVYNRGALTQPTVDSALEQDLPPDEVEIILVDDGSTDDTFAILERLYGDNARVRLFSTPNGGVANARNFGLEQARGQFIAYLDHDDLWLPQKLRSQREVMLAHPEAVVVLCAWRVVDENGIDLGRSPLFRADEWERMPTGRILLNLMHHNFIVSMTIPLIRTRFLRQVSGFDPQMVPCDDWDVWLKLAPLGSFETVREVLAIYSRHENQQSADEERMLAATQGVRLKSIRSNPFVVVRKPRIAWVAYAATYFYKSRVPFYEQARAAIASGDWAGVRRAITRGWRRFPWLLLTPQWLYIVKRLLTRDARAF